MKRKILSVIILICILCLCMGCGERGKSLNGEWIHTKTIMPDGSVISGDELDSEKLVISGDTAYYYYKFSKGDKSVEFGLSVIENSDGTYNFRIQNTSVFEGEVNLIENAEFKGDTLEYTMSDTQFIYSRK